MSDQWDRFVVENMALMMLDLDESVSAEHVAGRVAEVAVELGWRTTDHDGVPRDPSARDVRWDFSDTAAMLRLFDMLEVQGDRSDPHWRLTPDGVTTMLGILRNSATGPRSRP